ncbi:MAG TPA: hypothetical protein VEB68_01650 [Croceibacterium sp.]|nr:hypothetical protein [Croceibacterium sp.]
MAMTSQVAVARISRELREVEDSLDRALANKAALVATIVQARVDTAAPTQSGHIALLRLSKAQQSLLSARADVIRAHEELFRLGQERGDIADGDKPPPEGLVRFLETAEAA